MIQSVARAMSLLDLLSAGAGNSETLGDLTERVGLKAPTTHSLLRTLVHCGYAKHDPGTRRYSLGKKARMLGQPEFAITLLVDVATPILESVRAEFGETALVAIYRHGLRETVAAVESEHCLRVGGQIGKHRNFYETATGRILLSALNRDTLATFVREHGLPGERWPEVTTSDELFDALAEIRAARFVEIHRATDSVRAVAVPVVLSAPAALGMYYPSARPPRGEMRRIREHLSEAADELTRRFRASLPAAQEMPAPFASQSAD